MEYHMSVLARFKRFLSTQSAPEKAVTKGVSAALKRGLPADFQALRFAAQAQALADRSSVK
jgi:hypothetical protein